MGRTISLFIILAIFPISHNEVNARATLKIVNGTDAQEGEFPYMVQLLEDTEVWSQFMCGGSIIGSEWILTAAHCVAEYINHVASGNNHLYHHGSKGISQVKESFAHPKFTTNIYGIPLYDIALLQLEKPLEFTDKVQALKLPDNEDVPFHAFGNLSGWGSQSTHGVASSDLQKLSVRLLNDQECLEKINGLRHNSFQPAHHLCSDDYWNGACYGDSGSPFVINGTQYGVVSWSIKPCGSVPGVYSRITNPEYREWIRNVTGI